MVVRRSGIKIGIVQKSGPTLHSILTRSALDPPCCPGRSDCLACLAGLEGRCTIKNIVYRLTCTLRSGIYIGETKRSVRDRLMEHRRAVRNGDDRNPWGAHFLQVHADIRAPVVPFKAAIISRTHDHVDRKLTEAIYTYC